MSMLKCKLIKNNMVTDNKNTEIDNMDKKIHISDVMDSIEHNDNVVVIQINGKGYIKDMMESIISDRINDFKGEYHLFVDNVEIFP